MIGAPLVEVDAEEEEGVYDDQDESMDGPSATTRGGGGGSPIEGSVSGEDFGFGSSATNISSMGGSMGIIGKPISTNNFVTKLYQ